MINVKVSIVISVYNKESYVYDSVCSALNQTYENIEVVIVDDGSTDHSLQKLNCFKKDERVVLIKQENKGLSCARNKGILESSGDYIIFHDADDILEEDGIRRLVNAIGNNHPDIIGGVFNRVSDGRKRKDKIFADAFDSIDFKEESENGLLRKHIFNFSSCNKIFKREFLEKYNLKFSDGLYMQDIEFWLKCIFLSDNISHIPEVVSNYIDYPESSSKAKTASRFESMFKIWDNLYIFYKSNALDDFESFKNHAVMQGAIFFFSKWKLDRCLSYGESSDISRISEMLKSIPVKDYESFASLKPDSRVSYFLYLISINEFEKAEYIINNFEEFSKYRKIKNNSGGFSEIIEKFFLQYGLFEREKKQMSMFKNNGAPLEGLKKQVSFVNKSSIQGAINTLKKITDKDLNIALIGSDKIYNSLLYEANIFVLTESNWRYVLKHADIQIILIESCSQSCTGDWFMSQNVKKLQDSPLSDLIDQSENLGIPVAYWFTLDIQYYYLYSGMFNGFRKIYCADDRLVSFLQKSGINAEYLAPAVQPALFTKLTAYSASEDIAYNRFRFICDDLVGFIKNEEKDRPIFYDCLLKEKVSFFDTKNQVWFTKTKKKSDEGFSIIGSVDFFTSIDLLKNSIASVLINNPSRARTDYHWSIVESASSHNPILLEKNIDLGEDFEKLCIKPSDDIGFSIEVNKLKKDKIYRERVAQKIWRHTLQEHTFSHRVKTICEDFGLDFKWNEYPSVSLITPSYRSKFFNRVSENFLKQTYPLVNWVYVYNGDYFEYDNLERKFYNLPNADSIYVPEELHTGPCINFGINNSSSEYVFKFDDDDHYGENYILDLMLYLRVVSYDIIGKSFRFFVVEDTKPNEVFYRDVKKINFQKPSVCPARSLPEGLAYLAGCTHGGSREFFLNNPYPMRNFGSVDTQWLHMLKEKGEAIIVCADDYNMVVDRRSGGDHTWQASMNQFFKQSKSFNVDLKKVAFV